jgi:hypothetical protein
MGIARRPLVLLPDYLLVSNACVCARVRAHMQTYERIARFHIIINYELSDNVDFIILRNDHEVCGRVARACMWGGH